MAYGLRNPFRTAYRRNPVTGDPEVNPMIMEVYLVYAYCFVQILIAFSNANVLPDYLLTMIDVLFPALGCRRRMERQGNDQAYYGCTPDQA